MDPAACRVIYIDDRFNTERWISREGASPVVPHKTGPQSNFNELPLDLQANVNAFLSVFNQVYVCNSGRSFSMKLSELHENVKIDCTPIIACFDVGSEVKHNNYSKARPKFDPRSDSPAASPILRREITFSSESDESYGLQLLSRIASDLQVEEGARLIIPVAIVQPKRKDSYDHAIQHVEPSPISRAPYGSESAPAKVTDQSDIVDPHMMLQCLDAGALDVVQSPLDKAGIMGLTVHAYRIYKTAKNEQKGFMAVARQRRKQSWVGVEEEKPYAYLREAMVKKLLKGICEPQTVIEDYQHRDLYVEEKRCQQIAREVGQWSFCGHDFSEDELVYAGYTMLNHALKLPDLEQYRIPKDDLLRFMQGCQVAYNSFVLYHNFRHAVDVLQSLFYFLLQIGVLPPYPDSPTPPFANDKSPIAKLVGPFEALTLLISAIGHDVGHPGVNNMFLVKLNAPLAQLYNDQSVLEAFHCAAYSQILRRHWPVVFHNKAVRKLMISSILATDMGVHADYMGQLGNLQSKIHESIVTDGWTPKDIDTYRNLTCGLLIKCADISNVARPWAVAEKWTHLLQQEFAHQGEMESAVGMETTLFGGPPELGNMLKLANGQIGFMSIFAHPLFSNVADIIPAMGFAADEILTNKGVWFTRAEHEKKKKQILVNQTGMRDGGAVSPRSQSPVRRKGDDRNSYFPNSPLRERKDATEEADQNVPVSSTKAKGGSDTPKTASRKSSLAAVAGIMISDHHFGNKQQSTDRNIVGKSSVDHMKSSPLADKPHQGSIDGYSPSRKPSEAIGSSQNQNNGHGTDQTTKEKTDACGDLELNDTRRDNGVSMRAGSSAVPIANGDEIQKVESTRSELSKFTFATSDQDEPTRTFNPQHDTYNTDHAELRSSAPMNDLQHAQQQEAMLNDKRQTTSAQSNVNTMETSLRGGGNDEVLTPSQSTISTSYTSEISEQTSPTPKATEATARNRAISMPLRSPVLQQSYSSSSKTSEGSKNDIRTTIFSNGEVSDRSETRNRKASTRTLGRRGSRMKLKNLAFWKKREKTSYNEETGETQTEAS